jgi:hypothetical protein
VRSSLEQVLDTCIAELNNGADLEAVLAAYPEDADELRPMLVASAVVCVKMPLPTHKTERKSAFLAQVTERRRQVEATEGYVVEIKAGVPMPDLVARAAPEFRPLIRAAWRMFSTPAPQPSPERMAAGKARLMAMAAERRAARVVPAPDLATRVRGTCAGLWRGLCPTPTVVRRVWSSAVALLLIATILGAGAAGVGTAAASSLPGDSLYEVKELGRSAMLMFAFDPARRVELNLRYGDQRLGEIEALTRDGRAVPGDVLESWLRGQSSALADIQKLPWEQRRLLSGMLLASVDRARDELRRHGAVDDPAALSDVLSRSEALLAQARAAVDVPAVSTPEAITGLDAEPVVSVDPRRDHRRSASGDDAAANAPAPAPESKPAPPQVVVPPPVADAPPDAPVAQYVQPGDDAERNHARRHTAEAGSREPVVTALAGSTATETATVPPPAYNQPIFEEPTNTPEPPDGPTPQSPPGAGQGDPATPLPGETPVSMP